MSVNPYLRNEQVLYQNLSTHNNDTEDANCSVFFKITHYSSKLRSTLYLKGKLSAQHIKVIFILL